MIAPRQNVSRSVKNTEDWQEANVRYWVSMSNFTRTMSRDRRDLYKFYEAYNGRLDKAFYSYVTNPYSSQQWDRYKFPARIRTYPIIRPVVDMLLGEKLRRPTDPQVYSRDPRVVRAQKQRKKEMYEAAVDQMFINELNGMGINTGSPTQSPMSAEEIEAEARDAALRMATDGQDVVDHIIEEVEYRDKIQTCMFDFICTGEVYSYRDEISGKFEFEPISPLDLDYDYSPKTVFVEDGAFAVYDMRLTTPDLIEMMGDLLNSQEIKDLEETASSDSGGGVYAYDFDARRGDDEDHKMRMHQLKHVNWRSMRKKGKLFIDGEFVMEVDDSYKPSEEEHVDWYWDSDEIWEGYLINNTMIKGVQKLEGRKKLLYNGRKYSNRHSRNISIVELGMPFQILYDIYHYRLELTMAKNKDKVMLMEVNALPKKAGWDEDKFFYYMDAMGVAFVDTMHQEGNKDLRHFNQFNVLDMSLSQYIAKIFDILRAIKQEWMEVVGVSPQRMGDVMASEAVRNVNESIGRSSVVSEELFRRFESFQERDFNEFLRLGQWAYRDGKQTSFIDRNGELRYLDISEGFNEEDLQVRVRYSHSEHQKLEQMRQATFAFAQNAMDPLMVAETLDATSFPKLKRLLKEERESRQRMEQQAGEQQTQQAMEIDQREHAQAMELEDRKDRREQYKEEQENERVRMKIEADLIKAGMSSQMAATASAGIEENMREAAKLDLEAEKNQIKREEIASKERIENKKAETALKNKVPGEKSRE